MALELIKLLRVKQWYKNLIIYISLVFSFNLFNLELFILTTPGFISLCLISSSYYIINDIIDIDKDKNHPEKKNRPLASGKISPLVALIISLVLFNLSILIAYKLSNTFLLSVLALYILSQAYTFIIKKIPFLDVITISTNFVIRAVSGTFIINEPVSGWVILCTFFLSMFLVSTKRSMELDYKKYRPNYSQSDKETFNILSTLSITSVFIFFSIYSILTNKPLLLLSLPVALYIISNFFRKTKTEPEKIRNPEKFILSKENIISLAIWLLIIIIAFYL